VSFSEGLTLTNGPPPAIREQARALPKRYECTVWCAYGFARPGASPLTSAARSMLASEALPIDSARRSREITRILWPAEQTLVARASCEKDLADIDAGGLATSDRRLDFTPNPTLSLPVRLPSNRDSTIGLVAEGLPRLLPRRGKTIGRVIEIVAIVQVFRSGVSCGPAVAGVALELLSLRNRDQPEIVFGVLEIVLRGDGVAGCVRVAPIEGTSPPHAAPCHEF
jgi:hypothetical protein